MSDSDRMIEINNRINGKDYKKKLQLKDKFDIGIKMLRNQREQITNAGKYNERYKNTFAEKKEYPLSARYKDLNCRINARFGLNSEGGSTDTESSSSAHSEHSRPTPSPVSSPKFEKPVKLTSILNPPSKNSNATQDLNKTNNLSQLTSYKLVSDIKKVDSASESPKIESICKNKEDCINIYQIQPPKQTDHKNIETMDALLQVENYISQMEAEETRKRNMQKFNELCKNLKPDGGKGQKDKSQETINKKVPEHMMAPLKAFNEVENLLKPGVSDMEAENSQPFDRSNKIRSSTGAADRTEKVNKSKPLSRAASDAQEHKVPERVPLPRPRYNKNSSQVFLKD